MDKGLCVAFIFARGGSKGVPRKNVKLLNGKPLIAYSIETALESPSIDRVIVSTDDEEIASVAKQYGADVPFIRPKELAGDNTAEWLAWRHAIAFCEEQGDKITTFVSLPPTAPLRSVSDVEACIKALEPDVDIVITATKAERSPYFNMVTLDEDHFASLVIQPKGDVVRRQDAPTVYDMTTVCYVTRPDFVKNKYGVFNGNVKTVLIPPERAVDIDTQLDFKFAELLAQENNLC